MTVSQQGSRLAALLRELRLFQALSQQDLADRSTLSVRTIRDLERGRVARPQQATLRLLADALALHGAPRNAFLRSARQDPTGQRPLPPRRELIGRQDEVDEIAALLSDVPNVTLVGVAGVGKTSLALAVAGRLVDRCPAGVAVVTVPRGCGEDDLRAAVAVGLGVAQADDLSARLTDQTALVVLDGAEAAPVAAARTASWLHDLSASVHILATSRHPLGLADEYERPVAPLPVPPADVPVREESLRRYPASRLFLERIRQVRRQPVTDRELAALTDVVRRLGGHPLAIELMAARSRVLAIDEISRRYGHRPLDLAVPRHSGAADPPELRRIIADSYRVLGPLERQALRELTVFQDEWSTDLAERLLDCPDPLAVLDRLVEHGMVSMSDSVGTGRRFRILDIVRDYAAEELAAAGDEDALRARHAALCAALVEETAPTLIGPTMPYALALLDETIADLHAALDWSMRHDPPLALRIAAGLGRYWRTRGRPHDGRRWLTDLLVRPDCADRTPARARALVSLCLLAGKERDITSALEAGHHALALYQDLHDEHGELDARGPLTRLLRLAGRYDDARRNATLSLALAERLGNARVQIRELTNLVWDDLRSADIAGARRQLLDLRRRAHRLGDPVLSAVMDLNLAEVEVLDTRYRTAERLILSSLERVRAIGASDRTASALCALALVRAIDGCPEQARPPLEEARLLGRELRLAWLDGLIRQSQGFVSLASGDLAAARRHFRAVLRTPRYDSRNEIESRIGLVVAERDDPHRQRDALAALDQACQQLQVRLCPAERDLLHVAGVDLSATTAL